MDFYFFQLESDKIVLIFLSILLPIILSWKEKYISKIDIRFTMFSRYFNWKEFDKKENYSEWLKMLVSDIKEKVRFIMGIKIKDEQPLLVVRSGWESDILRIYQKEIKKYFCDVKVLNFISYILPIFIIYLILFSK